MLRVPAEQLRKLPGFEFESWAVLQLGEVLKHHGRRIRAQVNRAKVGRPEIDKFAHALRRDERSVGCFSGWECSRYALAGR